MPANTRNLADRVALTLATPLPRVLLLALLILLVAGCAQAQGPPSAGEDQPSERPEKQAEKKPEPAAGGLDHPALGEEDAPVVMVEYADYQ